MAREYTLADLAERREYFMNLRKEQDNKNSMKSKPWLKEKDPMGGEYLFSSTKDKKKRREEALNKKLTRWF